MRAARARWEKGAIQNYNYEWIARGEKEGQFLVYVRDGKVAQARQVQENGREVLLQEGDFGAYLIDGLFELIEKDAAKASRSELTGKTRGRETVLRFRSEPKLGLPDSYKRVVNGQTVMRMDVVRIDTTPLSRIPPLPVPRP